MYLMQCSVAPDWKHQFGWKGNFCVFLYFSLYLSGVHTHQSRVNHNFCGIDVCITYVSIWGKEEKIGNVMCMCPAIVGMALSEITTRLFYLLHHPIHWSLKMLQIRIFCVDDFLKNQIILTIWSFSLASSTLIKTSNRNLSRRTA